MWSSGQDVEAPEECVPPALTRSAPAIRQHVRITPWSSRLLPPVVPNGSMGFLDRVSRQYDGKAGGSRNNLHSDSESQGAIAGAGTRDKTQEHL